ncbi:hypothetical protein [Mucilaginibacter sp. UYCu711]|uniref:hypothetical protein n=1 Tax=Mucilaginibacter sp. UYCu711 TaxID=3156339 RepID=UPI003D1D40DD
MKKIRSESLYAIVHKGRPYIVNAFGYYPVNKSGNDFYFTGRLAQSAKNGVMASGAMYGAIGGAIAGAFSSAMSDQIYDVKIYYLTGDFIRLKEAKTD